MEFFERIRAWWRGFKVTRLLWLLLLWPFHVGVEMLNDRFIGGLNGYVDRHSDTVLSYLARVAQILLTHPVSSTAVFALLVVLGLIVHAYIDTLPSSQLMPTVETSRVEKLDEPLVHSEKPDNAEAHRVPIPHIECVQAESKMLGIVPIVSLLFKNIPNEKGEETLTAREVTATLTYGSGYIQESYDEIEEPRIYVSFGTWIQSYTRYTTFDPGRSNNLLIVMRKNNKLWTLENAGERRPGFYPGGVKVTYEPAEIEIPWTSVEVEVVLLSKGKTLFHGWFLYEYENGSESLKPLLPTPQFGG